MQKLRNTKNFNKCNDSFPSYIPKNYISQGIVGSKAGFCVYFGKGFDLAMVQPLITMKLSRASGHPTF